MRIVELINGTYFSTSSENTSKRISLTSGRHVRSAFLVTGSNIWFGRRKPEAGDRPCPRIPVVCQIHTTVEVQKFKEFITGLSTELFLLTSHYFYIKQ